VALWAGKLFPALESSSRRAAERQLAGQQLVKDDAKAVNVAAAIDLVSLAARLLGAHVGRRAEHLTLDRHGAVAGIALGQAEIDQPGRALLAQHDIAWFHIPVDDAHFVGVPQGIG
jgi:hypothetical protein